MWPTYEEQFCRKPAKINSSGRTQLFDSGAYVSKILIVLYVKTWSSIILKVEIVLFGFYVNEDVNL